MKYVGKSSVSSLLAVVLRIGLIVGVVATIVLGLLLACLLIEGQDLNTSANMTLQTPGLALKFSPPLVGTMSPQTLIIPFASMLPFLIAVLYCIRQLQLVMANFDAGQLLTLENGNRIKAVGVATIIGTVIGSLAAYLIGRSMALQLSGPGLVAEARFGLQWSIIALGVIVIVIGEVFNIGASNSSDTENIGGV